MVSRGEPILVSDIPFIKGVDEDIEKLKDRIHNKEHKAIVDGTKMAISRLDKNYTDSTNKVP